MLLLLSIFLGCGEAPEQEIETRDQVEDTNLEPVWYGDIEPFVSSNCTNCHLEGGSAPFSFEQLDDVRTLGPVMLSSMLSGSMPPWLPDPNCIEFQDERLISQEEIAHFSRWVEIGYPEGDPALGESERQLIEDIDADISITMPTGFIPDVSNGDQYRCFILDIDIEEETFLIETQVKPGSPLVHHVLVYALDSVFSEGILQADGQDGQKGYSCFGAPFPSGGTADYSQGFPTQVGAWVPGLNPAILSEEISLRIKPESLLVMQVHYSALGGEPTEDETSYHAKISTEIPEHIARTSPLAVQDLNIPSGASSASFGDTFTNYYDFPIEIRSVAAHMHLLGKKETAYINRIDGTRECLLDIPDWDFSWQQSYYPAQSIVLEPSESIEVTCTYDNSSENQPIINGEQIETSDVQWGDGTLDEMCLLYATFLTPYTPVKPPGEVDCYGSEVCFDDCEGSLDCLMSCEQVEFGCLTCALGEFLDCGIAECAIEGVTAQTCLYECYSKSIMLGSPIGNCMEVECPTEYEALIDCANPVMSGECAQGLRDNCGVEFD
jgi:hypothetical protein